ncbi:transposase [Anaerobacillus sp. MEB173]|uniref:transposase n=1 Tax=Anaerobacillus sp. MEB173 TaxID=3383345 RepID=UPI003F8FB038
MPRKNRYWFPGAMYHITKRGNRKSPLFFDDGDRNKYFEILEETRTLYPFLLHSYCLMTNHIHLQLETIDDEISIIMKKVNTTYAKYFNKKYDYVGHVFQGRYNAELIDSKLYEIDVSKYIHLNPCVAKMVIKPEDYRWSSYKAYIFHEQNPHVHTKRILSYFPEPHLYYYKFFVESEVYYSFSQIQIER